MGLAVLPVLVVLLGILLVAFGVLMGTRARRRDDAIAELLDLSGLRSHTPGDPAGEGDAPGMETSLMPLARGAVGLAGRMVAQVDTKGSLMTALERARIPLKPGEYVVASVGGGAAFGLLLGAVTAQPLLGGLGFLASPAIAASALRFRISRRRRRFEELLPDSLTLIASSLSAGHTFLRSIQMMCEESEPPLSEEFGRVVSETRLGGSLVDALDGMARRLQIRDLEWIVQAIRIQQTVGGKLADLLYTLAEFIRAREEVRREVRVLTAEGRISAYVLGALPVFLLLAIQVVSPHYLDPMFRGAGLVVLAGTGASVVFGTYLIFRMVKAIEV
ncbi:MAG: type II secretion system F family protein [Acidimicrobiales bacterium]